MPKLLDDVKAYLKSNPRQLDWQKDSTSATSAIGWSSETRNAISATGGAVDVEARAAAQPFRPPRHRDHAAAKAGRYLLTAKMPGGNTSYIVLWVADTAIVKKPLAGKTFTTWPTPSPARRSPRPTSSSSAAGRKSLERNRTRLDIKAFRRQTDADGQIILDGNRAAERFSGSSCPRPQRAVRLSRLPGSGTAEYYDAEYNEIKTLRITDRPVYRPDQTVKYKFWVRHAKYDQEDTSEFAKQAFTVEIHNPKGEEGLEKDARADAYGGIEGEIRPPGRRHAGQYHAESSKNLGGGSFRVEEYKKPEFEVTVDAPTEPVMLGEKITATIKAKYYFGSPVTKAKVKYKVKRTSYTARLVSARALGLVLRAGLLVVRLRLRLVSRLAAVGLPRGRCPFWWPRAQQPPEVVAEHEVRDRPRRHGEGRDRHGRGQGHPPRPGPQLLDHRRGGRRVAADDRRHGQGAGRPQAVQGLRLGRSRLLPRRRHDPGRLHRPDARRQAGPGQGRADAAADHLRQGRQAGRNAGADLEARHQRGRPARQQDHGRRRPGSIGCRIR